MSLPIFAPDRRNDAPDLDFPDYVDHLSQTIVERFPHGPLTLIGFSAGARMALELSVKLGDRVDDIILISAAAPLQSGNFLDDMAGRMVFVAAQRSSFGFTALTAMQSVLARLAPSTLYHKVFSTAAGADAALKSHALFKQVVQSIIVKTLQSGAAGYQREIQAYVQQWGEVLPRVTAPVTIWHGTADNWTPITMAEALINMLPNIAAVHRMDGLSHYSTLKAYLATASVVSR